ncbi:MAG: cysteine peptidase family C39 domain-containing protein [Nanoarchaeota archaeon]
MRIDLPVPLVLQEKDSVECGLAGLSMLYGFYGKSKTIAELKEHIKIHAVGTYAPQLGTFLRKDGFHVEIITHHPSLFVKKEQQLSQEELKEKFKLSLEKQQTENVKNVLQYFHEFLENKGKLTVKIPTPDDVIFQLKQGHPVGALVTSNFVHGSKAVFNYHFLLIRGVTETGFIVNDPIPDERGGVKEYTFDEFRYALYASAAGDLDNASLFIAYPDVHTRPA